MAAAAAAEPPLVLITGAAGFVGNFCRRAWGDGTYRLRLVDARPLTEATSAPGKRYDGSALASWESFVQLDISDLVAVSAACAGVRTVVHLAADPSGAPRTRASGCSPHSPGCTCSACPPAACCRPPGPVLGHATSSPQ